MPKKFGVNQANIISTTFAKCHLGQNRKRIIGGLFLNMAMKYFAIFEEDVTQKNYENYLGILGVIEIWVASHPRANMIIPLSEKEYFQ